MDAGEQSVTVAGVAMTALLSAGRYQDTLPVTSSNMVHYLVCQEMCFSPSQNAQLHRPHLFNQISDSLLWGRYRPSVAD